MQKIVDLHIHSKYSRATSPKMNVLELDKESRRKGIHLIGTGDFTHPAYLKELKAELSEDGSGFMELKKSSAGTKFVLSTEIACIYKDKGQTRRIHMCYLLPTFKSAEKVIKKLEKRKCNLRSDGRPIIGLSVHDLTEIFLEADERTVIFPAHIWTPWFALFGSKSGYDRLEDCFEDLSRYIYAVETGLSSDPPMNWRLSALDDLCLISNSDAHSPANIGREANVFDFDRFDYQELYETLKNKDLQKFKYTIEFYPEEGRYHYDGHAKCKFSCPPQESEKQKNICPVCKKPMVLGVEHRVNDLADREVGYRPKNAIDFKSLVPFREIVAECLQRGKNTKGVNEAYENILEAGGNEFNILLNMDYQEIAEVGNEILAEAVRRVREGEVKKIPGYDGEYGIIKIFSEKEIKELLPSQNKLL